MKLYIIQDTDDNVIQAIWFDKAQAELNSVGLGKYYEVVEMTTSDEPLSTKGDDEDHYNPAYGYGV